VAQGRLTGAALVLALGIAAEALAPAASPALTAADFLTGAAVGLGGAWLLDRTRLAARLAIATSVAWFAGTLSGSDIGALSTIGTACVLAYRGPLVHLLSGEAKGWARRAVVVAAWAGGFLPVSAAGPVTSGAAALAAALLAADGRRAAADRRRALLSCAGCAAVLAALWLAAVLGAAGTALALANDAAVIAAAAVSLTAAAGMWTRAAASALVVSLGRERHPGRPVTARLARALADPELELCYALPGLGWVDEQGRPVAAPGGNGRVVTRAAAPGGGEVALVHAGGADLRLAAAATAAAALALDSARLEAELRAGAAEVRASRRRLLATADGERRSLEARLNDRVLARLRRVDRLLASAPEREELSRAVTELTALARGLHPPALERAALADALAELAARATVPVDLAVDLPGEPPAEQRAAIWFICAEALANVGKHAGATRAGVRLRGDGDRVALEVTDDGRGGATAQRGLRGIADRVDALGGTLVLSSPPGGPTRLRAELPL
jgi:signal transduction histidine kinase